ncbi:MAG: aminotransferase class I/II-fold pyridoxal phosphate-dependent enzyme [Lentisphaerae bacterium]|jgi:aspartate/methionine/tyrosine aminotransferase|nr:aminotransferase class I/II-fold pyridoxal phosphate-dependent enzyme [Lentisphaerota bacterium]
MPRPIHPLARALNADLATEGSVIPALLSRKGLRAFFPSKGILGQSAEARQSKINATIGTAFEEDGTPLCMECLEEMVRLPSTAFLYAPSAGIPTLREEWSAMLSRKNPSLAGQIHSLPVVTHALTHGLFVAGQLFLDPRERLILPDLYWDNYELVFEECCGARLRTFRTFQGQHFNVRGLERLVMAAGDKKVVLLNFPNNPTGYTATDEEALEIRDVLLRAAEAGKRLVVILDDAYFGLVYEKGVFRESLFTLLASLHPNLLAVKLDGPTKEDYVWGLRVGFVTYGIKGGTPVHYKALEAKSAGIVRATISSGSNLSQQLLAHAFTCPGYAEQKAAKFATLEARYRRIRNILREHPEYRESFTPMPFNSGYFMCVKPVGVEAETVRQRLLAEYQTGTIVLGGLLRLAFSCVPLTSLDTLFANLHDAIRTLKSQP